MKKYISILIIFLGILIYLANISLAKYQINKKSNTIIINSHTYTPLTAIVSVVTGEDNKYSITLTNNNEYEVKYKVKEENDILNVSYENSSLDYATIPAKSTQTINVTFSGKSDAIYEDAIRDTSGNLYITVNMCISEMAPYIAEQMQIATNKKMYLDKGFKNVIIANAGEVVSYEEGKKFTGISTSTEADLCSIIDPVSKETIYFFRGNITSNYVSFAGYTWRILRINSDGSLRLILNTSAGSAQYKSSNVPTTKTIDGAIEHLAWSNSTVYTNLHTWYNNNIATNYSDYVVESNFVFDTSYDNTTSTTGGGACYYFGAYNRVGSDANNFQPTFAYDDESLVKDYVGLITADEILYAGGYWQASNSNYFLYNSSIGGSWTMSPSFWDNNSHYKAGMLVLDSSGKIDDWPSNGNTLTASLAIRPVISIRGDKEMTGTGTANDPYKFADLN